MRLEAVQDLLPSSLNEIPLRAQLIALGIFPECQQLNLAMEAHDAALKVTSLGPTCVHVTAFIIFSQGRHFLHISP